jgi:signal peptidase I
MDAPGRPDRPSRAEQEMSARRPSVAGRARRGAVTAVTLVLLGAGWWLLGPTSLGGPASYVVTDGTSMLPHFHADGLVVTRRQDAYHVGEVVAYRNRELGTVVMHRIVARDGARYVFQGDNNDFRDDYHPTAADLVGREWVYWGGAGRALKIVRMPAVFAILAGLLAAFAAAAFVPAPSRRRHRHHAR